MYFELNYEGKKLPVQVGYYALKATQNSAGEDFNPNQVDRVDLLEYLLYHSMVKAFKKKGEEMPYKFEDMEDILEENFLEFSGYVKQAYVGAEQAAKTQAGGRGQKTSRSKRG